MTVLQSFSEPSPTTNPYLVQLLRSLSDSVDVRTFSWRRALRSDYDVLHVHWPEVLLRGSDRPRTYARRALFALLLARLRLRSTAIVRTRHNLEPHERPVAAERLLIAGLDRLTTLDIQIHPAPPEPAGGRPERTILHGHYRDWYQDVARHDGPADGLVYFGLIRPYKGVDILLDAFHDWPVDAPLRIAGSCRDVPLRRRIESAAAADPRIRARLEYVDDASLADEVTAARLVVLPYRAMFNSGAALLALSLDRPVLVPTNPGTRALGEEVGPGWVHTYEGQLTAADIDRAYQRVTSTPPSGRPDLQAREWKALSELHHRAYAEALELARPRATTEG